MKIGTIADIHGRYEALAEVLRRLGSAGAIINLGDVADFTPQVNACYDLLKQRKIVNLIGNHEQEVLSTAPDQDDIVLLDGNGEALSQDFGVNEENKQFIKAQFKLGMSIDKDGLKCHFSHGHKVRHGGSVAFEYLSDTNIRSHFETYKAPVSFCGHLHRSQMIEMDGTGLARITEIEECTLIKLDPKIVYGFNVGMLSRKKGVSGCLHYAVLDTVAKTVEYVIA